MANIIANKNKKGEIISYRIRVSLGYDLNGNQIQKTTTFKIPPHTTESKGRKMAQEYAVEFEQYCRGYSTLRENMRFSELAEWYFQNYAPVELKESTVYNYKSQYENHLAPKIGNMKLKDLDRFSQIVIQVHDNPDADAVGSGYAIYEYFKEKGKDVRLIYSGKNKLKKSNMLLMLEDLKIPLEILVVLVVVMVIHLLATITMIYYSKLIEL